MTSDDLEPVDPQLAQLLDPARTPESVSPARRRRIRQRLEAQVGSLEGAQPVRDRRWLIGLVVAAAVAALVVFVARDSVSMDAGTAQSVAERRNVKVGDRGIAVLEPHSDISWTITASGASVEQARGRVFYRVEPGDAYVVRTPAADVRVTGTSFEVELIMSTNKQRLKSMSLGAALATTAVVTVYEGRVVLANEHGSTELEAGQSATADAEHPPSSPRSRVPSADAGASPRLAVAARSAPDPVLVSDLRARIRELEGQLERAEDEDDSSDGPTEEEEREFLSRMYDPSPAQLRDAVENCELSFAIPGRWPGGGYLRPGVAEELGLAPEEVDAMRRALDRSHEQSAENLRSIYIDATGDESGAGELSENAMQAEIFSKSVEDDRVASRERVIKERAGLLQARPPGEGSPVERFLRHQVNRASDAYAAVVEAVGEDRAYAVLKNLRISMANYSGCGED